MRKGTGLVISGSVLLIPPLLVLGLLTIMSTRFGSRLLVHGLASVGVQEEFVLYADPVVVSITGVSGLILLLIGLRMRARG